MKRSSLLFFSLAFSAGVGFVACAQDAADLGSSDPSTSGDVDGGTSDGASPYAADTSTPPGSDSGSGSDTSAPPQDSGDPLDAGTDATPPPPPPDAAPLPNGDCDTSNPVSAFYYAYEYGKATNPPACPCSSGYCCYNVFPFPPACIK